MSFFELCREPFAACGLDINTMDMHYPIRTDFYRVGSRYDFSNLKPLENYKDLIDRLEIKNYHEFYHEHVSEILAEFVISGLVPKSDFIIHKA